MSKFQYVIKRNGAKVPFTTQRITNAIYRASVATGGRDKNFAKKLAEKAVAKLENKFPASYVPHIEEIQDVVEEVLIEAGESELAKAYIIYRAENMKRRQQQSRRYSYEDNVPWEKIWRTLVWAQKHDLDSIDKLNKRIRKGEMPDIIKESEQFYQKQIDFASQLILDKSDEIKMVMVSGPSSSGKTTTTIKLEKILRKQGFKFVPLNVDNYFFDLDMHPKDEFGDYDFETPQALDLELINKHINQLLQGREVKIPFYDFSKGKRTLNKTPLQLKKKEILIIDSLHGLNPQFAADSPEESKFKLYLEPLLQMRDKQDKFIRWTDIRMMRRMLRDAKFRAYKPAQTLEHWHYVRASEMRHIIPNAMSADFIINSAMPYELSFYKYYLINDFKKWTKQYKDDPLREDALMRATRVYSFLKDIQKCEQEDLIPKDSVIREFLGGSELKYH
ncbi:MAG: uridine kinase [Candidatus Cloacimonadota bacterium]|jgi:uridine kinase|nr:uridine kinase [Candidatus Cloacimonadota bacterium]